MRKSCWALVQTRMWFERELIAERTSALFSLKKRIKKRDNVYTNR